MSSDAFDTDLATHRFVDVALNNSLLAFGARFGFTCAGSRGASVWRRPPALALRLPSGPAAHVMNPRLTRSEFWLLSRIAVYGQSLRALGLPEGPPEGPPWDRTYLEQHYNCRGHGLAPRAFARCLHAVIRKGWVELWRGGQSVEGPITLSQTWSWLSEVGAFADGVYAVPTKLGGEVWEAFASPDWDRYIDDFVTSEHDGEVQLREVTTIQLSWLRRYRDTVREEQSIDSESMFEIADWELSCWKPRVAAYRWTFRAQGPRRLVERPSHYLQSLWCEWR